MAASKGYTLPELVATSVKDLCDEEREVEGYGHRRGGDSRRAVMQVFWGLLIIIIV